MSLKVMGSNPGDEKRFCTHELSVKVYLCDHLELGTLKHVVERLDSDQIFQTRLKLNRGSIDLEQNRVLRNDGHGRPEVEETDLGDVDVVDVNFSFVEFGQPQHGREQRRLSGAGAADDADLLAGLDVERQAFEHLEG